jgi:DHA2 family multidrug resistance protein
VDFKALVWPMLVQGVAMSLFFISMVTLSLNGVKPQQLPAASGLSSFVRITAGSFAASLATTIWDRREALHQTRLSEIMGATDPAWLQSIYKLQLGGLTVGQAVGAASNQVVGQAYLLATLDFFRGSAWLMFLLIPMIWLTNRAMGDSGHAAGAD